MLKKHKLIFSLLAISSFIFVRLPLQAVETILILIQKKTAITLRMMKVLGLMGKSILSSKICLMVKA